MEKIIRKEIVELYGKYWVDSKGNRWSTSKYTKERAILHSKSLVNCVNCTNCYMCSNCKDCSNLINCKNCIECCHGFDNEDCYGMVMFSKMSGEMMMEMKLVPSSRFEFFNKEVSFACG